MGLTDTTFVLLVVALAVASPVVVLVAWSRLRGPAAAVVLQRVALVVLAQVLATFAVLVVINDQYDLYTSWNDLTGLGPPDALPGAVVRSDGAAGGSAATRTSVGSGGIGATAATPALPDGAGFSPYDGGYLGAQVAGAASHVTAPVYVWLPPQYHQAAYARVRFPVVELLSGFPGSPTTWFHAMDVIRWAQDAIHRGAAPFVLVVPSINVAPPLDTECTDMPGGPRVATWLAVDVPQTISTRFRVRTDRTGWAAMGYSTGGFCAQKLVLQFPRRYRAGVSLAGYSVASSPAFVGHPALVRANSPRWLVQTRPAPPVSLLLVASREDPGTVAAARQMLASAARPTTVAVRLMVGGHNTSVWQQQLSGAFTWLSAGVPPLAG